MIPLFVDFFFFADSREQCSVRRPHDSLCHLWFYAILCYGWRAAVATGSICRRIYHNEWRGGSLYLHNQLEQKIDLKTIDLSRQYNQKEAPAIINRSNGEQKETKTNKHTGIGVFCIIHKHRASVAVFDDSNGFGSIFCVLRHLPRDTSNAPRVVCIASQWWCKTTAHLTRHQHKIRRLPAARSFDSFEFN